MQPAEVWNTRTFEPWVARTHIATSHLDKRGAEATTPFSVLCLHPGNSVKGNRNKDLEGQRRARGFPCWWGVMMPGEQCSRPCSALPQTVVPEKALSVQNGSALQTDEKKWKQNAPSNTPSLAWGQCILGAHKWGTMRANIAESLEAFITSTSSLFSCLWAPSKMIDPPDLLPRVPQPPVHESGWSSSPAQWFLSLWP